MGRNVPQLHVGCVALVLWIGCALGAHAQETPGSLRLLKTVPLPPASSIATDIRWGGPDSVFVSWESSGIAEIGLDGVKRHTLAPNKRALGLQHYDHLATSSGKLAVASLNWEIAWRTLTDNPDGKVRFQTRDIPITLDFDLQNDKVVLLGIPRHNNENDPPEFSPQGDVAWIGTLSSGLRDLKPVLYDVGGRGAPHLDQCDVYPIGAVRFLADGSFVVAPGFQDGIHLFDPQGRKIRSWTSQQIGVDAQTICGRMSEAEAREFAKGEDFFERWLNSHHSIDDVLPLPRGPGVLVRSWGTDGQVHWTLKVLQADGIKTYRIPVTGHRPFDRLRGDVRDGQIALLLSNSAYPDPRAQTDLPAEVYVVESPKN
jgi:hypothetical protein